MIVQHMLFEHLFNHARQRGDDLAIADDTGQYTWQQLAGMSAGLGMYISAQTTAPNVGVLLPASAGYVASFYGSLLAGKSVVPINFLLSDAEVAHVIADSGIDTVITIPQLAGRLAGTPLKVIDLMALPRTPAAAITPRFPSPHADDTAVLIYTSGTSGRPKGVMLTYGNLQTDVDACIEAAALKQQHTFLGVIPLFHAFGMTATMLAPVQLGATMVYMTRFSAVGAMENIRRHKVSLLFGVPSMFAAMARMDSASADDFRHVYALLSGGEPLPAAVRDAFLERVGKAIQEGYGMSENSPVVSLNTPQAHRAGSVGRPLPGVDVRIVDDNGKALPAGHEGEVWLKGPMVMKGYYRLEEQTRDVLTGDGFLKTGDLGRLDGDGFLYITGRKKDLIISAGEKAVPREIEEVLLRHPAVAEAAVVGRKDPARGEVPVAFVVAREGCTVGPEELRSFTRDQGLAQFKVPRQVIFVPALPRTATGKVLKRTLVEQLGA